MHARVLGTGSADGWPNPHCSCASCSTERAAGRLRGQSAVLVDDVLLLDCGPDTPAAAQRAGVDLTRLRHVLITHAHPDHCAPAFLLFRSWVGAEPLEVVGPAAVVEQARLWVAPDSPVRFVEVAAGDRLDVGDYAVRVLAAAHGDGAVLYDVATSSARLLYATDTGPLPDETVAAVRDAAFDVVLLEETFGDKGDHGTDHLHLATFAEQLRRLRHVGAVHEATDVVAIHLSHHNPPTPELSRRLADWGARVVDDGASLAGIRPPPRDVSRTLVLGGARSGKSREAERLLLDRDEVVYVATAYPADHDQEWSERVRLHQESRPGHWATLETLDLVGLLGADGPPLLVDCLTLWLTRVMDRHDAWDDSVWQATAGKAVHEEVDALVDAWRGSTRRVVAVSNEVGQGVVPVSAAGRRFRDEMGRLNTLLSAATEDVRWCTAGRVRTL
ncbi:MAG: bifunctional adenosylcobinamide kinase/adenosylcobinamide-phosphate guanylyltransferase [Nocardioides sp.]